MSDIKLAANGDLFLDNSGSAVLVEDDEAIVQQLLIRFKFALGEWFLDIRIGVPFFQEILVKNPNLTRVRAIYRQLILTTPGIESLEKFSLTLVVSTRALSLSFTARKTDGGTLEFNEEFIIK